MLRKIVPGVRVGSRNSSGVESTGIHSRMAEVKGSKFRDSFGKIHLEKK